MSGSPSEGTTGRDPTVQPLAADLSKIGTPPIGYSTSPLADKVKRDAEYKSLDSSERLTKVLGNLAAVKNTSSDGEVNKRIKVMEKMWQENKLEEDVQLRLLELSEGEF